MLSFIDRNDKVMNCFFGECLVRLRKRHGRSQKYVALEAGLDPSYLAGLERGRRPPPRDPLLGRIMKALGATPSDMLEIRSSLALTKLAHLANELEPAYGQALVRIATGMQSCSADELKALETIVQGFEHRRTVEEKHAM